MDNELPSEILAQIALNLPLKDLNSLLRVSKIAHWKLQRHRNMLSKATVTVQIARDATFPQVLIFKVQQNQKCWRMTLGDRIRRNEAAVEEFYENNIDPTEGLALHLQFILSKANIETIRVKGLFDSEITEITKATNKNATKFGTVDLHTSHFRQCHQDLIIACNPQTLTIDGCHLLDSFYRLPVIQKLTKLHDFTNSLNNIDLSSLSASNLIINKLSNIDFSTIATYLKQWTEKKREVKHLRVLVKITTYVNELRILRSILEQNLISFSFELVNENCFYVIVRREIDDANLCMSCLRGFVSIRPTKL